ncbi:class I SAM-dependent methyltransferase [Flavobacteriaceae bacterium TP-CH-4]|uniref:Class I SAM-dependent methyltransferase n=1 Tax=Pelagihabitans pacificus TaxID=2696054 RepID=A0A967ECD3_9FLAO|nr:class I SAM-dependent methyltransferase [Pelagihabitans pacificus]NHF61111.1 class I SAM-dependent methyltransferase [Pelagihabitans pacificus]
MNNNILKSDLQDFINKNYKGDILSVLFKKPIFEGISNQELAQQLEAKEKCRTKLPTWFRTSNIYYPKKLNIEQTSSEITARYKAEIISGKTLVDLTGGLGVDCYFFSQKIAQVFYCEKDLELSKIARHNFEMLGAKNIAIFSGDGLDFLKNQKKSFDWIYIDPSRRHGAKGKVFLLSDSTPNVVAHLEALFAKSDNLLIKTSPLLDLSTTLDALKFAKEVHIVSVLNEVRELLWVLQKGFEGKPKIRTINYAKHGPENFVFEWESEKSAEAVFSEPMTYLYEPNAAIMKSGAFKTIGNRFGLYKLDPNTHLYTSKQQVGFPGRVFLVKSIFPYNRKSLKQWEGAKANITTRNFHETVATIRKKYRIKEGGDQYLFFTRTANRFLVLSCIKVSKTPKIDSN